MKDITSLINDITASETKLEKAKKNFSDAIASMEKYLLSLGITKGFLINLLEEKVKLPFSSLIEASEAEELTPEKVSIIIEEINIILGNKKSKEKRYFLEMIWEKHKQNFQGVGAYATCHNSSSVLNPMMYPAEWIISEDRKKGRGEGSTTYKRKIFMFNSLEEKQGFEKKLTIPPHEPDLSGGGICIFEKEEEVQDHTKL